MIEREKPYQIINERTRAFLLAIIAEGGQIIPEELRNRREGEARAREQNIIGAYYCSEATLDDLGKIYGENYGEPISAERIRQIIKKGMRRLWKNSSKETKEIFPWKSLPLRKPVALKTRREMLGEKTKEVMEQILAGKSYYEIREGGIDPGRINQARKRLKKSGFTGELPYGKLAGQAKRNFINRLESAETPEQIRAIFDEVKNTYIETRFSTLSLVKLGDVLASCGFQEKKSRKERKVFVAALEKAGVVVGYTERQIAHGPQTGRIQKYYFIRSKDFAKAREILG